MRLKHFLVIRHNTDGLERTNIKPFNLQPNLNFLLTTKIINIFFLINTKIIPPNKLIILTSFIINSFNNKLNPQLNR